MSYGTAPYGTEPYGAPAPASTLGNLYSQAVEGVFTPLSSINKLTLTNKEGSLTTSGTTNKFTTTSIKTGSTTPTGEAIPNTGLEQAVAGSTTPSGGVVANATFRRAYEASMALAGGLVKRIDKMLSSTLTLTGQANKQMYLLFSRSLSGLAGVVSGFKFTPAEGGPLLGRGLRFMRKFIGRR